MVYVSGRPETPQGDQRRLKAMQGYPKLDRPKECLSMIWWHNFVLLNHVALFGTNRTNDRPAETFVYVVFHSRRIMYVHLVTVYANFAQEAR